MVSNKNLQSDQNFHFIGISFLVGTILIIGYTIVYYLLNPVVEHTSIHYIFYAVVGLMLAWGVFLLRKF